VKAEDFLPGVYEYSYSRHTLIVNEVIRSTVGIAIVYSICYEDYNPRFAQSQGYSKYDSFSYHRHNVCFLP
jgi:hypothetical protein